MFARDQLADTIDSATLLLEHSPSPMLVFAPDLTLLFVNEAHVRMTGRPAAEIVGQGMFKAFPGNPKEAEANAEAAIQQAAKMIMETGEPVQIDELQHDLIDASGRYERRYWSALHWPIVAQGRTIAIVQRSQDITDDIRARKLIATEKAAAERSAGLCFFSYDPQTGLFDRSSGIDAMFGFAPGEAGQFAAPFFERVHEDDLPSVQGEVELAMSGGEGANAAFDYRVVVPGQSKHRHIRVRAGIARDPDDGALKLFGAFVDMSDIEWSRAELDELSRRNASLVIESHHRIRNSLAIASAILSQQMRASEDNKVQEALRLAATRIAAIAEVHGELFKDTGVERVDAGSLVKQFAESFHRTIGDVSAPYTISTQVETVYLPSRYAVTVALTLNELLTNAIKYGLSSERRCTIEVALKTDGENAILFVGNEISSTRLGQIASQGVGSRLILAFANQLDAKLETSQTDDRFEVRFEFPVPERDPELPEAGPCSGD